MRNKGLIIALTVVVSVLCAYFLFFTYISRQVQDKAVVYATRNGQVNETQRQHYLDSVWRAPVFGSYTYRDVKQSELGLGLDLKGGMHVTLEVSPVEIVRAMANNSKDPAFNKAIALAQERQKTNSGTAFTTLFAQAYQETAPGKPLARLFANSVNKDRGIDLNTSDSKVLAAINKEEEDAIGRSFDILRKRVDKFGVNQPNIQRVKGTGRIQVELPGVDNPDRVRKLLQGQAKLEFYEVWPQQEVLPYLSQLDQILGAKEKAASPTAKADSMIAAASAAKGDTSSLAAQLAKKTPAAKAKTDSAKAQQGGPLTRLLVPAPGGLLVALRDTAQLNRLLRSPEALATLPSTMALLYEKKIQEGGTSPQAAKQQYLPLLAVRKDRTGNIAAPVSGEVVSDARQDYDQSGRPEVSLTMNPNGTRKWAKMTAANIGKQVAVVLDDVVYSAPVVQTEITGGQTQISGNFTVDEAQELAQVLKAGKLPAPTRIVEEAVVGPSLGQEAINQGLYSSLAGLLIIMAFMAVYYGRAGLVADAALLFNMFLVLGVLAQFGTALTLPGIAGLILVIASSVDANVLIFERIREELDHGVPLHDAVNAGYKRAFSAIFDSNVTTFIIGLLLFFFGTGPVQNFAITLLIGIFTSFLSAVYVSRLIIEFLIKGKETSAITFSTFLSRNLFKNVNFDIVGKRKIAYAVSTAIIVLGFVLMYVQGGPNLGVDFQGGRSYIVNFNKPMVASEVRDQLLPAFKGAGLEVKQYGQPSRLSVTTGYLATDESQDADKQVRASLDQGLNKFAADKPTVLSTSKVGATIADDIKRTSVLSLALTLAGIFLYVLLRFEKWQYSLAAVVALFHDALLVIASYPIAAALGLKYEMDQIFVAAVLTVIGFSMNDTVVIYDRIREYLRKDPNLTFRQVANPALNSTFSRTMITFTTVFLVVLVLYIFGGETLRSFSFAMMVGIIFGTYSSLFIATPIILDTYGKKEEAERRAAGEDLSTVPGNAPRLDTATA